MSAGSLIVSLITVKLFFLLWHVDGLGVHIQRCFHDALGNRGVRMNGVRHFLKRCFHLDRQRRLVDEVGCVRAEDGNAKHFAVFLVSDDLYQTAGLIDDQRLAAADEGEAADLHVAVLGLCFLLGHADACDFRAGVDGARH